MGVILYAWELGGGYGHTSAFLPIARMLKERGHEVIFALRDLEYAETLLGTDGFCYLQAPMRWPVASFAPPAFSYPELLRNNGFADSARLFTQVKAWQALYRYVQPNLIVFDHAPTGALAARQFDVPQISFGTGFFIPPPLSPLPNLRPWQPPPQRDLLTVETQVLATINTVLQHQSLPPLPKVADLLQKTEACICTFPELDHYRQRGNANYIGPMFLDCDGIEPRWPVAGNEKLFAYLAPHYPALDVLLAQLKASPWSVLVHIPATTPAFIEKHSSANLHISARPLNISAVAAQCDLAICHGGVASVSAFLLRGKPLLVLPNHLEQLITARNANALGAATYITPEAKKPNFKAALAELLGKASYRQAAEAFAGHYADFCPTQQAVAVSERCEALLRQSYINGSS